METLRKGIIHHGQLENQSKPFINYKDLFMD